MSEQRNVYRHERAFQFHAACNVALSWAAQAAVLAGTLRPDDAWDLQRAARNKMNTAQVRQVTELVLQLAKCEERASQKLLPSVLPPATP